MPEDSLHKPCLVLWSEESINSKIKTKPFVISLIRILLKNPIRTKKDVFGKVH
jgi:hypothetical protein